MLHSTVILITFTSDVSHILTFAQTVTAPATLC